MPWSPVLDQDKWYKAIQTVSETLKKTQDNFSDPDWDAVAEKYAQDGGRFKVILPPDPKERDLRIGRDDIKKVSGLMTSDVHVDVEAIAKNLEETRGKAAADFVRCSQLVESRTPPAGRQPPPIQKRASAMSPVVPQLTESPQDDVRRTMKALIGSSRRTTVREQPVTTVEEEGPEPTHEEQQPQPTRRVQTAKRGPRHTTISESVTDVAKGENVVAVARKLIESALRR